MRRPMILATCLAGVLTLSSVAGVSAGQPNSQSNELSDWTGPQQPVGPGQEKMAQAKTETAATATAAINRAASGDALAAVTLAPEYLVGTWERQQTNYYYCGPTAIQVMADYVWQTGASTVKYTQKYISDHWTHTTTAGTGAAAELKGANGVLVGSRKSSFPYWSYQPTNGSDWSSKLTSDLVLDMPQLINLQPWWQTSSGTWYYLHSWAGHKSTGGHWITGNGMRGAWDGSSAPTIRYDDGSGGYGGSTGTYWDPQYDMWQLIRHHNNIVIW
jgi:hypothetical protein